MIEQMLSQLKAAVELGVPGTIEQYRALTLLNAEHAILLHQRAQLLDFIAQRQRDPEALALLAKFGREPS